MFGIGMPELILILAVALIVIGPKKLPDLARSLGRALGEFKKATRELKESIDIDHDMGDLKKAFQDVNKDLKETAYSYETDSKTVKQPETEAEKSETAANHSSTKGPDHD
jgi:sec-independent protein translocase protein TatB